MIRYALICQQGHQFESWFQDSAAYDKQAKRGLVSCPHCGSAKVEKAIMAPRLSATAKKRSKAIEAPETAPEAAPAPAPAPVAMISPQEQEIRAKEAAAAARILKAEQLPEVVDGEGALDHNDGHHRRHHSDAERGGEGDGGKSVKRRLEDQLIGSPA